MYIDLTMKLEEGMVPYPGDVKTRVNRKTSIAEDGYNTSEIIISSHAGTHIDMPSHIIEGGASELECARFIGIAGILDVRGEYIIEYNALYGETIEKDDIVILYTGASESPIDEEYYTRFIKLEQEFIDFLIETDIKMLGIDCASIEPYGETKVHEQFLRAGIPILENLSNLSRVPDGNYIYELFAMPLNIACDGLHARVVLNAVEV